MTSKEFGERVKAKMDELTAGLSLEKLASIDHVQLNAEAIKLVQAELLPLN